MKNIPENIIELLNKYSIRENGGSYLSELITRVSKSEPIIPVLGLQGVGKSTLINALLEENILPNEVDETTCVPVEVKYGEEEYADVYFRDSDNSIIVHTIEELRNYVDNNFNPGNEKRVLRIVLHRKRDVLKSGIVIVDLPGVGSLTHENQDTTLKYIENLCTAIFVMPIIPAIRKSEALFIKAVWSKFSRAIFVQNHFNETNTQIEDSVNYNTKELHNIANNLNNTFDNKILVVNAYKACEGAFKKDLELIKSSNITSLISEINDFALNWRDIQAKEIKEKILMTVESAIKCANKRHEEIFKNRDDVIRDRENELHDFQLTTDVLEEEFAKVKSFVSQKELEIRKLSRKEASNCIKELRSEMNRKIDNGIYDGEILARTFKDEQDDKVSRCLELLFDEILNINNEIIEKVKSLSEIVLENDINFNNLSFDKKQQLKYEKGLDFALKTGGMVGGYIAGAKVGAFVGTTINPGIGSAIGAVVGSVIGLCAGMFVKRKVGEKRAAETKQELQTVYDEIESRIKTTIIEKFRTYADNVKEVLNSTIKQRRKEEIKKKENVYLFEDVNKADKIENEIKVLTKYKALL